jgi:NCAIR mutase (PurE)-related protein
MNEAQIKDLLNAVHAGDCSVDEAVNQLKSLPFRDLGFAKIDHHRTLRRGFPEVIYCEGKTPEQVVGIAQEFHEQQGFVLGTRADAATAEAVLAKFPEATYDKMARVFYWGSFTPAPERIKHVAVLTAGTVDIPVAEEAALTAEAFGMKLSRHYDVGVAGLHRLLSQVEALEEADVLVVVAGMDGALPSVVSGLWDKPLIAVPTSQGYGASFSGLAPLLTMLSSCSPGVSVVNIDNGFGAGYFASII